MECTATKPTGMGIHNHNCITFSSGIGVTGQVSCSINWAEILELARNPQSVEKQNARWILPSSLPSRKAQEQEQNGKFGLLWADLDNMQGKSIDEFYDALEMPYALVYATKSATSENQRCRVLVPLSYQLNFDNWLICQKKLNCKISKLGVEVDESNLRASQILFLPNSCEFYKAIIPKEHQLFDPQRVLRKVKEEHPPTSISPIQPRTARGSVITQFKASFSVSDILQQAGYKQNPVNPLQWRHPRSESGSFSASIDPSTGRVHSLSSRDPLWTGGGGQGAHDSFSVFCVLFCDRNLSKAVWKAANEMLEVWND